VELHFLGLIPARAGSKGVPEKNSRVFGDRPLIAHSIDSAVASRMFERVIVSTDSEQIAQIAREYGAEVPWLRPSELATDAARVTDVALHALQRLAEDGNWYPDALALLQPTSPFRCPQTIRAAVELFAASGGDSVVSVSLSRDHPYWCKRVTDEGMLEDWQPGIRIPDTRQQLPPAYRLNGVISISSVRNLLQHRSFYSAHTRALVLPEEEAMDIDSPMDWQVAEYLWARRAPRN
jgi:CMP-N,N'-diacetyllegionaminic acid synthase